jgi:hypothetical protein
MPMLPLLLHALLNSTQGHHVVIEILLINGLESERS